MRISIVKTQVLLLLCHVLSVTSEARDQNEGPGIRGEKRRNAELYSIGDKEKIVDIDEVFGESSGSVDFSPKERPPLDENDLISDGAAPSASPTIVPTISPSRAPSVPPTLAPVAADTIGTVQTRDEASAQKEYHSSSTTKFKSVSGVPMIIGTLTTSVAYFYF
mmetsp:Transcript_17912/g.25264  ORF Transcript_17912/g.25264 Transcript_17912/m.25264 type:complete len:164 (+) Transcript_17912:100-591(+)